MDSGQGPPLRTVAFSEPIAVQRVQTGVRMEARLLGLLKEVAEARDWTLGKLLEDIVVHALAGPGSGEWVFTPREMGRISKLIERHGIDYDLYDVFRFEDTDIAPSGNAPRMTEQLWDRVRELEGLTLETATGKPFRISSVTGRSVTVEPLQGIGRYAISKGKLDAVLRLGLRSEELTAGRLFEHNISLPVYKIAILRRIAPMYSTCRQSVVTTEHRGPTSPEEAGQGDSTMESFITVSAHDRGQIARRLVAGRYGLRFSQLPDKEPGYNAISRSGERYQVVYRSTSTLNVDVTDFGFDYLLLVNLNDADQLDGVWRLPVETAKVVFVERPRFGKFQATQAKVKAAADRRE